MRWLVAVALIGALAAGIAACERVVDLTVVPDARGRLFDADFGDGGFGLDGGLGGDGSFGDGF